MDDERKAYNLIILDKVAIFLHKKLLEDDGKLKIVYEFQSRMRQGMSFYNEEDENDLRGIDLF